MKVISFCATKGGVGKSTACFNLAAWLHTDGVPTVLIDSDKQGTSMGLAKLGNGDGSDLPPMVALYGKNLGRELPRYQREKLYKLAIVDTPGRLLDDIEEAMMVSDLVVIPAQPSPNDLLSIQATLKLLEKVRAHRKGLEARILLNGVGENVATEETRDAISRLPIPAFKTSLGDRQAFRKAGFRGVGVTSYEATSMAAEEVRALAKEITRTVGGL